MIKIKRLFNKYREIFSDRVLCKPMISEDDSTALFHDLCKHGKWHKIQNGNRAGKSQDGLPPIIAY